MHFNTSFPILQTIKHVFSSVSHSSSVNSLVDEEIQQVQNNDSNQQTTIKHQQENTSTECTTTIENNSSTTAIPSNNHHSDSVRKSLTKQEIIPFGLFNQVPCEVIENHIFPLLDFPWFFRIACLVSKEWNQIMLNISGGLRMIFEDDKKSSSFIQCCKSGRCRSVTSLVLAGNLLPDYLEELVNSCGEQLPNLTSLDVGFSVGIAGPVIIGNCKLPNLTKVNFNGNKIECNGLRQLSKGSTTKQLKHLVLIENSIAVNGIMFLSNSNLCNLTYLDLSGNSMTNEALKFLSNGKLSVLVSLILSRARITNQGIVHLVNGNLRQLTELDLHDNYLSDEGGKSIANGKLNQLTTLDLSKNNITMDIASQIFTKLTTLKHFQWKE